MLSEISVAAWVRPLPSAVGGDFDIVSKEGAFGLSVVGGKLQSKFWFVPLNNNGSSLSSCLYTLAGLESIPDPKTLVLD